MNTRITILCLLIVSGFGISRAQNLVLNPSFENFSACPIGPSEFSNTTNWQEPFTNLIGDTCSTSDLYNSCNPLGAFGVDVPNNIMGNQAPITGNGYAGIIINEQFTFFGCSALFGSGWREYVEGDFSTPLVAGQDYCVTVFVSLADNVVFASDDFGVHLANSPVNISCASVGGSSALAPLGVTPQLTWAGGDITNTSGWTMLQWPYTATGGERHIIFGNFQDDGGSSFTCVNSSAFNPYAYYYVEDISVVPGNCGILPVALDDFSGTSENGQVRLDWKCDPLDLSGVDHFVVERSADGVKFTELGRVELDGNTRGANVFQLFDPLPEEETTWYRLRQAGTDGIEVHSKVVAVSNGADAHELVEGLGPNPAAGPVGFRVYPESGAVRARLFDLAGRVVWEREYGEVGRGTRLELETEELGAGWYSLEVLDAGNRWVGRLQVIR